MRARSMFALSVAAVLLIIPVTLIHAEDARSGRETVISNPRTEERNNGNSESNITSTPSISIAVTDTSTGERDTGDRGRDGSSTPPVSTTTPDTFSLTIRDGSIVGFTGSVQIPASTTPPVSISPSGSTTTIPIAADSLLATLVALDASSSAFDITDLQYFSSFNAFYINCISIPAAASTPLCGQWQFQVNGVAPQVGADHVTMRNGDSAFLYFGYPRQVTLSTSTVTVGENFTATAQAYDPSTDAFTPVSGVTIGVTQNNPANPFTPLVVASSTSNASGQAIFAISATGTYAVGIAEDFYFPSTSLTVSASSTPTPESAPPSSGGSPAQSGGGGSSPAHNKVHIIAATSFLTAHQRDDGSFDTPFLSDWAAFAFASAGTSAAKDTLKQYLLSNNGGLSSATDYERHAMALMALGVDPYVDTSVDYISKILSFFDGTQFGSSGLVNDDIFALFPLTHAGYDTSDPQIAKAVAFIVAKQKANGSWEDSVDLTASAIQALASLSSLSGVSSAIDNAKAYLHTQQQSNGGFGNSFSTSWAMQAIAALGENVGSWSPGGLYPEDYLASLQQSDGGIEPASSDAVTRIWATEYAVPASLGKTWNSILSSFSKPAAPPSNTSGGTGGSSSNVATTTLATSTPELATTSPEVLGVSTSTEPAMVEATSTQGTANSTEIVKPPAKPVKVKKPKILAASLPTVIGPAEQPLTPVIPASQTASAASANASSGGLGATISDWFKKLSSFFSHLFSI